MNCVELDSFISANDFFAASAQEKISIISNYVDEYGPPEFVYGLVVGRDLKDCDYLLCNFSYWVSCVFITYSNLNEIFDDPKASVFVKRIKKLISINLSKSPGDCGDAELAYYYDRSRLISRYALAVSHKIGSGSSLRNMDEIINIWDFVPHPKRIKLLKSLDIYPGTADS